MSQFATLIPFVQKEYHRADGRFASAFYAKLLPDASRDDLVTATQYSNVLEMGDKATLRMVLDVTEKSGTLPTLDVTIETSPVSDPDSAHWATLGTFATKIAVSTEENVFPGADRFVRAKAVLGGTTPVFRFSLDGEAV